MVRIVVSEWGQQADRDSPATLDELQASVRRVLGVNLAMRQPRWLSRFTDAAARRTATAPAGCWSPGTPPTSSCRRADPG
jgi:hypothetical protein